MTIEIKIVIFFIIILKIIHKISIDVYSMKKYQVD